VVLNTAKQYDLQVFCQQPLTSDQVPSKSNRILKAELAAI